MISLNSNSIRRAAITAACIACASASTAIAQISNRLSAELQFSAAIDRTNQAPNSVESLWQYARATFDLAEFATNNTERADLANLGIAAARAAVARQSNSVQAHYYLGMNLGQLARTRFLSALKIVDQIEKEFLKARELDPKFDHGGPDRNLGLLYKDAPSIGSIGSRRNALHHLVAAIDLAPSYPENRLNLIEAYLGWSDRNGALREYKEYLASLENARKDFPKPAWDPQWNDWDARATRLGKRLKQPTTGLESPHK